MHADMVNPPAWLVGMDLQTLAYIRHTGGFTVVRAAPAFGLFTYANCRRFPDTPGCRGVVSGA